MKIAYLFRLRPDLERRIPPDVEPVIMYVGEDGRYREEDLARVGDADAFVIAMEPVNEQILAAAPNVKIAQRLGVGYETLDLEATARRGVYACNIEGVNKDAVAEHCMALILALAKNLFEQNHHTHAAEWVSARRLTMSAFELQGKTIGIVGLGNTGSELARRARAFGMNVIYNDVRNIETDLVESLDARSVDKATLFESADVVSINTDLNDTTRGMVDAAMIAHLQPHALFICCARGGIVDEAALRAALDEGRIAGAAVDVFSVEPIRPDNALIGAPRCILSAHVAGVAKETTDRIWEWAHQNVRAVVERGERPRWIRNGI